MPAISGRQTLADANDSHDWRIYADFAQVLMVAVRELLQNGIDAVRYQNYLDTRRARAEGKTPPPIGRVVVQWDSANRLLTVEDSGTGMTRSIIDHKCPANEDLTFRKCLSL